MCEQNILKCNYVSKTCNRRKQILDSLESGIKGSLEVLKNAGQNIRINKDNPEEIEQYSYKIEETVDKIEHFIANMNLMNKIICKEEHYNIRNFLISDCYYQIFQKMNKIAIEKQQNFQMKMKDVKYNCVNGDDEHLAIILEQIIINAIIYSKIHGKIEVNMWEAEQVEDDIIKFYVKIQDNGMGMEKEFLSRIYDPFARERRDGKSEQGRLGVGMCIVKALLDVMEGEITIQSQLDRGTCVELCFPLKVDMSKKVNASERHYVSDNCQFNCSVKYSLKGKRALLVENNEILKTKMIDFLKMQDLFVEVVEDGELALKKYLAEESDYYDIIFMDVQIPIKNGYEVAREIRKSNHKDAGKIPIVAMTAAVSKEDIYVSKRAGMNEHITKPFNLTEMEDIIKRWLI